MDIEFHRKLAKRFIKDSDNTDKKSVRIQYGLVAGWFGIYGTFILFVVKMTLGILTGSVSVIANAFHLLSHLANSIILVVSFKLTARPATAKNPFGHGRMEHIAPLIMSIFLFISGIQIGEHSLHQAIEPHELHCFSPPLASGKLNYSCRQLQVDCSPCYSEKSIWSWENGAYCSAHHVNLSLYFRHTDRGTFAPSGD